MKKQLAGFRTARPMLVFRILENSPAFVPEEGGMKINNSRALLDTG